jgi:hypothetical protein
VTQGKYGEIVYGAITAFLIVAAVTAHVFTPTVDLTFVDAAALLALGALYGKTSAANGYAKSTAAAHMRLDAIGAPASHGDRPIPTTPAEPLTVDRTSPGPAA